MIDFGSGVGFTHRVLDALDVRAKVVLHNLANQNTPGYKRFRVRFEELLRAAHERGEDQAQVRPIVERDLSGPPGLNNVSPMEELALLEKVRLLQDIFTRRAGGYFSHLNKAIYGRG